MPLVSFIAIAVLLYLSLTRYSLLTGVETVWINNLQWLVVPFILAGAGIMLYLRSKRRPLYELIWPDQPLAPVSEVSVAQPESGGTL